MLTDWLVDTPETPVATLILAHGAGAGADSAFMQSMAALLCQRRIKVIRFNFPYMQTMAQTGRRRPPERMPILQQYYTDVVHNVLRQSGDTPLFIGGKSMGGRVATLISESLPVAGSVVFGYPFHPAAKPDNVRTAHLADVHRPMLIVQGARDALGRKEEVLSYALSTAIEVHFLDDGDHDFKPRKASGFTQAEHLVAAANHCATFIENCQCK